MSEQVNKARFTFRWYGFAGSCSQIEGLLDTDCVYPVHTLMTLVAEGKIDGVKIQKAIGDLMRETRDE